MKSTLQLSLNKKEKIIISIRKSIIDTYCCVDNVVFFAAKKSSVCIGKDTIYEFLEKLLLLSQKALKGDLEFDAALNDIGLLYNIHNRSIWSMDEKAFLSHQKGPWKWGMYKLWAYKHKTTWLYNDKYGNIILQVTPWFDYYNSTISFDRWVKEYKSIMKRVIKPEIVQEWIVHVQAVLKELNRKEEGT